MRKRFATVAVAALATLGLAWAAEAAPGALEDENVLLPLLPGFHLVSKVSKGPVETGEFVPDGETVSAWSRMVTQQIFHNLRNAPPDGLPTAISGPWRNVCQGGTAQKLGADTENGYPASTWAFTCPLNPVTGKPEYMWMRTISGADALYGAQYAIRSDITPAATQTALAFLRKVTVCDTRLSDRPCPNLTPLTTSEQFPDPVAAFLRAADKNDFATMRSWMDRGSPEFFQDISKCYLRVVFSNKQTHQIAADWMCAEGPNRSRVVLALLAPTSGNKVSVSFQQTTNDRPAPERTGPAFQ